MSAAADTWSTRTTGIAGIEGKVANVSTFERMSIIDSLLPSGSEIKQARRLATKTRASTACRTCTQLKKRCSDERPCSRCIRNGKSESCLQAMNSNFIVQRPMAYHTSFLELKNTCTASINFFLRNDWAYDSVMKICAIGYQAEKIARCFDSIPPQISYVLKRVLKAMEDLASIRSRGASSRINEASSPSNNSPENQSNQELGSQMLVDAARWETQRFYGFFQVPRSPISVLTRRCRLMLAARVITDCLRPGHAPANRGRR
jgi:hypothetical protein